MEQKVEYEMEAGATYRFIGVLVFADMQGCQSYGPLSEHPVYWELQNGT